MIRLFVRARPAVSDYYWTEIEPGSAGVERGWETHPYVSELEAFLGDGEAGIALGRWHNGELVLLATGLATRRRAAASGALTNALAMVASAEDEPLVYGIAAALMDPPWQAPTATSPPLINSRLAADLDACIEEDSSPQKYRTSTTLWDVVATVETETVGTRLEVEGVRVARNTLERRADLAGEMRAHKLPLAGIGVTDKAALIVVTTGVPPNEIIDGGAVRVLSDLAESDDWTTWKPPAAAASHAPTNSLAPEEAREPVIESTICGSVEKLVFRVANRLLGGGGASER